MPNACHKHIAITPFSTDLVLNGVNAVTKFDPSTLKKLTWPQEKGCRKAQGGDFVENVAEDLRIVWQDDRLIFPVSEVPQALAERSQNSVIRYQGMFIAQLDGQVAYQPSDQNIEFYYILVENVDHKLNAIRFGPDQTAVIDPFVKHSMPLPARFGLDYTVHHRPSNAIEAFLPDSVEPPIFNLMKVDRVNLFAAGRIPQRQLASSNEHFSLSKSFSKKLMTVEEPTADNFEKYGQIITDPNHVEQVHEVPWPGVTTQDGYSGPLEQDFQMSWIKNEAGHLEIQFKGFSGSFAGDEGKPGVEFHPELGVYKANLLLTRPDGTFFLKPASTEASFLMAFALAKNNKGEPDDSTLKTFVFHGGRGIRLHPFVYHTVPIPLATQESLIFSEIISATNANIAIDVLAEAGHPIQFAQGV
ncbi:hypothetical protein M3Y97_00022700 [Aphelenchoides bicaudatus]|nr:hypothetical protein M3Y97_00022700 [Aphelenchoides bicaudatus]